MAGGLESYDFDRLLELYYLYKGLLDKMTTNFKKFESFWKIEIRAKNTQDIDLLNKITIVKTYKDQIPDLLEKINQRCCYDASDADYIFTTTHKAKGLEWKTVILLDDFFGENGAVPNGIFSIPKRELEWKSVILDDFFGEIGAVSNEIISAPKSGEEENILYVAMTRAKTNLVLNFALFNMMLSSGDTFERIVRLKEKKVI